MKQDFEKQMANRLADYKRQAPEGLLDSVKAEMSRRAGADSLDGRKQPRVVPLWAWRVAGVAAMIAVAVLVGTRLFTNSEAPQLAREVERPSAANGTALTGKAGESPSPAAETSIVGKAMAHLLGKGSNKDEVAVLAMNEDDGLVLQENPVLPYDRRPSGSERGQEDQNEKTKSGSSHRSAPSRMAYSYERKRSGGGFSLGAYYSGASSVSASNANTVYADAAFTPVSETNLGRAQDFHEDSHHHSSPVKVGAQVRYNISDRWSVQSGVTYTQLSSDFNEYNSHGSKQTSRKMHFVGIPVGVSYSVYKSKRFNVYLTAGGEAQKMVSGKDKITTVNVGKSAEHSTAGISMSRLQLSANAAVGAEVNVGGGVSVYAEPGATYYFDNSSDVKSYYTEHPMKLSLNVGVRFNINK